MKLKALAAAICLMASAQMAQATLVDFYGVGASSTAKESAFKTALLGGTLALDQLEDPNDIRGWGPVSGGSATGSAIPLVFESVSSPGTFMTPGSTFGGTSQITSTATGGRAARSGVSYWDGQNFSITFGAAVSAFGFWGSDIGDFDCPSTTVCPGAGDRGLTVQLFDSNNVLLKDFTIEGMNAEGSTLFWGFVDKGGPGVKKVVFANRTGGLDAQGFDDFMVGVVDPNFNPDPDPNPTPEPGVLLLVGLALAGAAGARRRR